MSPLLARLRAQRVYGVLQLALFLSGCMSWRPELISPADLIATQRPDVVRITQDDSSEVILRDPAVQGDTLFGRVETVLGETSQTRTGIPLAEVKGIETLRSNPTKTTLLSVALAAGTFSILCFVANALGCHEKEVF
jgi:hypothetical protein